MTDDEAVTAFKAEMANVQGDQEGEHGAGDAFIEKVMREHGFPRLADAYRDQSKDWWYA